MRPFFVGSKLWPPGLSRLHVYVLPDPAVDARWADLVTRSAAVLAEYPEVALVAPAWLHATVQRIDGEVTVSQRQALITALNTELAGIPAFVLTAGPPLAGTTAVVLDLDGDQHGEPWSMLTTAVRTAVAEVLGPQAIATASGAPHISLAYGIGDTDSGPIQGTLRHRVRPGRAPLPIDAVYLVDVAQQPEQGIYSWSEAVRIPLSG